MTDAEIERFEAERPRLRAIAYRILGTPDDADDAVQDAWLRYSTIDRSTIENLAAWLTTVVTRVSVDRLRSASHTRETYVGPWLPEPVLSEQPLGATPEDKAILAESLSIGMLAVLERLSPLERAVFILHDVFAYPLTEVAQVIERQPAATRQLAKRARDHISAERPRFARDPDDVETLTQLLMAAALEGDVETLQSYLVEDVIHISDGGANYRAARAPIVGRERVARFFINLSKRIDPTMAFHAVRANGQLAGYITQNGEPFLLLVSNWIDGKIVASYAVRNADKLASFHRAWTASS